MLGNVWEWTADAWHQNYEGALLPLRCPFLVLPQLPGWQSWRPLCPSSGKSQVNKKTSNKKN